MIVIDVHHFASACIAQQIPLAAHEHQSNFCYIVGIVSLPEYDDQVTSGRENLFVCVPLMHMNF